MSYLIVLIVIGVVAGITIYRVLSPKFVTSEAWLKGPNYLRKFTREITPNVPKPIKRFNPKTEFVKQVVSSNGSEFFKISFKGNYEELPIKVFENGEVVINAITENNEEFLIYNGFIHGWNSLVCGEYDWTTPEFKPKTFMDSEKNELFSIYICCRYNPVMMKELKQDANESGIVELGEKNTKPKRLYYTQAFFEGFDSITIWAVSQKGKVIEILSRECA